MTKSASGYRDLNRGADPQRWRSRRAQLSADQLLIEGHPVMERWEAPYMQEFAALVTRRRGRVLECGFGLGLSATAIQSFAPSEHVIIEANQDVFGQLETFAARAVHPVTPLLGLAEQVVETLPAASFDGIFYDTYPLNAEQQHVHQFGFIAKAYPLLKPGGVLSYCNLTSIGVLKNDYDNWQTLFEQTQLPHLLDAGIGRDEIRGFTVFHVDPPADCRYYRHASAILPIIIKAG